MFSRSPPKWWCDKRDAAQEAWWEALFRRIEKERHERHAKEKEEAEKKACVLLPVKIIVVIVLLVIGVRNLGDSVGDTVVGVLWIWAAFGFFRKFILKD